MSQRNHGTRTPHSRAVRVSDFGWHEEDHGCHPRPHQCVGVFPGRYGLLAAQQAPKGLPRSRWELKLHQNPVQQRDGRGTKRRSHEQAWPGGARKRLEGRIKREKDQ